jgi:hypothetical protein
MEDDDDCIISPLYDDLNDDLTVVDAANVLNDSKSESNREIGMANFKSKPKKEARLRSTMAHGRIPHQTAQRPVAQIPH